MDFRGSLLEVHGSLLEDFHESSVFVFAVTSMEAIQIPRTSTYFQRLRFTLHLLTYSPLPWK